MNPSESVRMDKWLWAVRIFKTRGQATEVCRLGRVQIDGHAAKPSRGVKINEVLRVKTGEITRTLKVIALLSHRVSPQIAKQYMQDLTPVEELARARDRALDSWAFRPKGLGRPTKKDRRVMEDMSQNTATAQRRGEPHG